MPGIPEYSKQMQIGLPGGVPQAQSPSEHDIGGQALQEAGREVMRGADALRRMQDQHDNLWVAQTASKLAIAENQAYSDAQNKPSASNPGFAKTHEADLRQRVQDATSDAPSTRAANQLQLHLQPWLAGRVDAAQHWEVQTQRFTTIEGLKKAADDAGTAAFTSDQQGREAGVKASAAQLGNAWDQAAITPEERARGKEHTIAGLVRGAVLGDVRDNPALAESYLLEHKASASAPASFLDSIRGAGTPPSNSFLDATRMAESGGKAIGSHGPGSSAYGAYGLTKGWWTSISEAHPELGLQPDDRFNDIMQHKAMQAAADDYGKIIQKAGYPATYTNMYMVHFLGGTGAARFLDGLKMDPNADARDYVAAASADANPAVFNGRSAQEVYSLYAHKFGGAQDGARGKAPEYYGLLTAPEREQFYAHAHAAAQHKNTLAEAAFAQTATDALSKASTLGVASNISQGDFVNVYGPDRGASLYNDFQVNHEASLVSYKINGMPTQEAATLLASMKPGADTPNYDTKYKIWSQLSTQLAKNDKALWKDSAAYLTDPDNPHNAAVVEAAKAMRENANPQTTGAYVATLDSAQARMGIPENMRALISQDYAADISKIIEGKIKASSPDTMQANLEAYKATWGSYWDRIYPQLKGKLSPVAEVALSGVDPHVAQILLGVAYKSAEQLAKDTLPVEERKTLSDTTVSYFENFSKSLGAAVNGVDTVGTFAEQARKLAVVYRSQGTGISDAADKAYKDIIGNRYTFHGLLRVPKDSDFDGIEGELYRAKQHLPELMQPTVEPQDTARLSPEHVASRMDSYAQLNGVWMTEPGDKGAVLVIDGKPVLKPDKTPVFITWESLRKEKAARDTKLADYDASVTGGREPGAWD